ncbi:hypothetical protein CKF54_00350 [Psittacicella hinzii]|uniref:Uncharacterized protein n=1 Tax=Psittacicella hinzii TaxID=2028575 RepID=A0A3A1YBA8_9GAMM|nr:hypothetical protein [Psittacicella hinzii]RIY34480.1 hypothetical protein CKF54_00350 [Psittacicella hinzii]
MSTRQKVTLNTADLVDKVYDLVTLPLDDRLSETNKLVAQLADLVKEYSEKHNQAMSIIEPLAQNMAVISNRTSPDNLVRVATVAKKVKAKPDFLIRLSDRGIIPKYSLIDGVKHFFESQIPIIATQIDKLKADHRGRTRLI